MRNDTSGGILVGTALLGRFVALWCPWSHVSCGKESAPLACHPGSVCRLMAQHISQVSSA